MAALAAEDAAEGGGAPRPGALPGFSSGGGGGSTGGGSSAGSPRSDSLASGGRWTCEVHQGDRKTKHCLFRLGGILISDSIRPAFLDHRPSAMIKQLDESQVGWRNKVWVDANALFIDIHHKQGESPN